MNGEPVDAQDGSSADVLERLDRLADLFRRRLLEDRDKRRLIDELHERVRAAEAGPFRQYLRPLVLALALLVDRMDRYEGADPEFVASVRDELLDSLARHGIALVDTGGPVDPTRHEVVAVEGEVRIEEAGCAVVARAVRRGYQHDGWVFRPAQVVAAAPGPETR